MLHKAVLANGEAIFGIIEEKQVYKIKKPEISGFFCGMDGATKNSFLTIKRAVFMFL